MVPHMSTEDTEVMGVPVPKGTAVRNAEKDTKKSCTHWVSGGGCGVPPMHVFKTYAVKYVFSGFNTHHRGSKMIVARPCVIS